MHNIYLVGFMGAGKSSVGKVLAERLGRVFVDLDEAIERRVGMSIPEVFSTRGEAAFRQAETAELELCARGSGLVVSTGGGAFCCPDNRRLIRASGGTAIYLDVPWAVIRERLGTADSTRPKWTGGSDARQLFEDRCADYLQAPIRIRLDGGEDPDEVAGRITAALAELACAS